jgi:hypothetical protein
LIVEYGFCIENNRYDFYRFKRIDLDDVKKALKERGYEKIIADPSLIQKNLDKLKLKEAIRCDLKLSGLHRDILRLIRSCLKSPANEAAVLDTYRYLIELKLT